MGCFDLQQHIFVADDPFHHSPQPAMYARFARGGMLAHCKNSAQSFSGLRWTLALRVYGVDIVSCVA